MPSDNDPAANRAAARAARATHPGARRRHGHDDPGPAALTRRTSAASGSRIPPRLKGNNDLLNLTRPHAIEDIHAAYLRAGADIVATNTFNSTSIARPTTAWRTSPASSTSPARKLARARRRRVTAEDGKPRFVAGALGPTNRTASMSPDVNDPGLPRRHLRRSAQRLPRTGHGLLDGGVDLFLVETIFDTLNAKAAINAITEICEARGIERAVMISGTITDRSGRTLSGQTPRRSGTRCATPSRSPSASTARWAPKICARTSPSSPASPTPWSAPIPTPACPTPSASTTRRPETWRG